MGCGTPLQTTDPDKPGYVSEGTLVSHGEESYCYRCYQIRNYGKTSHYAFDLKKYQNQLSVIKKQKSPVLLILDVLDIYGSFHPVILDVIKDSEVVILINKIDLLPNSMKLNRIEERVRELGKGYGLNVKNVILISSLKDFQLDRVMDSIIRLKKHGDVYLVGLANTGKSSFLNALINKYAGQKKDLITTSYIQGTTCDVIKVPLDESAY
jgi:ribosome biogenesis GTPase A